MGALPFFILLPYSALSEAIILLYLLPSRILHTLHLGAETIPSYKYFQGARDENHLCLQEQHLFTDHTACPALAPDP